ncbi:hypothetical protein LXL04_013101 [Taraxacum kok-saghyz]
MITCDFDYSPTTGDLDTLVIGGCYCFKIMDPGSSKDHVIRGYFMRSAIHLGFHLEFMVIEELVFNCLDAGATKVIVAVGVGTNYIKVTDNGCGITRDGLVLVGERYATCKFEQLNSVPESFGFRGEALSSICDVSLLQVVTKAHGMPNGYCKVIKCSKCLYLGIHDDRQDVAQQVKKNSNHMNFALC